MSRKAKKSAKSPKRNHRNRPVLQSYTGTLSMTREGFAFATVEGLDHDIFVSARKLHGALHGDTVQVALLPQTKSSSSRRSRTSRTDGEVVSIISRSKRPYVGILQVIDRVAWVITDSRNMPYDIWVSGDLPDKTQSGLKVAILVNGWNRKEGAPQGNITDILGKPGENNTEMHAILTEFGLPYRFEAEVEAEADRIPDSIPAEEIQSRRDFRTTVTFTIDPTDAKDFDDALSLQTLPNGNYEVGVHIADVSYYVRPGSLIDKEALERGTSVYLVDRTVPMLPEKLSNQLCSLRPQEDKLCFSAVFELDAKAKVINSWFGRTVIHSDLRLDYGQAQQIIETGQGPLAGEIGILHTLADLLRKERFKKGAISFERPEYKVEVDPLGKPLGVHIKESQDSNWLIEEFMLLANRSVAYYVARKQNPKDEKAKAPTFVYRVHEEPNIDKITAFRSFITHFGYQLKATRTPRELARELSRLLDKVREKPEAGAIEIMALRSMARARYATDNLGHYGLAFDYYTHFTSPIRRYPDLMVHRLLAHYLADGKSENKAYYENLCRYDSEREQIAAEAERASVKYKMVEFMQDKIGMVYEGCITGLTEWGMYVELIELHVEGMIPLREIRGDYFEFDADSYTLRSRTSKRIYRLGDSLTVKVVRANLEQKQLDYALVAVEK
ncbi:MAG: ribonuclease R [Bacteroidales bacterium]|nr:ribonuclease R [Bacteroidales bacterium]